MLERSPSPLTPGYLRNYLYLFSQLEVEQIPEEHAGPGCKDLHFCTN